jgi:hypothetical protein
MADVVRALICYLCFSFLFDDDIDLRAPLGWLYEECSPKPKLTVHSSTPFPVNSG